MPSQFSIGDLVLVKSCSQDGTYDTERNRHLSLKETMIGQIFEIKNNEVTSASDTHIYEIYYKYDIKEEWDYRSAYVYFTEEELEPIFTC